VALTGTNHAEDQPVHLRIGKSETKKHVQVNVGEYAGLLGRACPAAVYEYVEAEGKEAEDEGWDGKKLVINSQVRSARLFPY
jgi:electron-transferring-flavoprotein dehydrogenase